MSLRPLRRQVNAIRLRDQAQEVPIAVEGPGAPHLHQLQGWLVIPIEESLAKLTFAVAEDDLDGLLTDPLDGLNRGAPEARSPRTLAPAVKSSSAVKDVSPCRPSIFNGLFSLL